MNLGLVLQYLAGAGRARLTDAIAAYQRALRTFDRARFPAEFAILQNNLATAFLAMPLVDERAKMREALAVQAFEEGLKVVTLIDHPSEYAMLQNNLGNALQYASSSHAVENNLRAIEAYDEALKVRTRDTAPLEYANTIANKANCLMNLPDDPSDPSTGNQRQSGAGEDLSRRGAARSSTQHGDRAKARLVAEPLADACSRRLAADRLAMDSLSPANARDETLANLAGDVARLEATVESWAEGPRDTVRAYRAGHRRAACRGAAPAGPDPARQCRRHAALRERWLTRSSMPCSAITASSSRASPSVSRRRSRPCGRCSPATAAMSSLSGSTRRPPRSGFIGACDSCPASTLTIDAAVKTAVQAACPEITEIVQAKDASCVRSAILPHGTEGAWFPAGMIADMPEGGIRAITLGGRAVILGRSGTRVTCFDDACVHLGAALYGGIAREGILTCPWHGFRYDLLTGACQSAPGLALRAHETMVVGLRVLVRLAA